MDPHSGPCRHCRRIRPVRGADDRHRGAVRARLCLEGPGVERGHHQGPRARVPDAGNKKPAPASRRHRGGSWVQRRPDGMGDDRPFHSLRGLAVTLEYYILSIFNFSSVTDVKNSFDQSCNESRSLMNGRTSFFACLKSTLLKRSLRRR